ncbi:MAG: Fic family protein [Aeromicrobium sp.]|nr:MAG: Fic family protein [Aeromicrobium sp.]
MDEHLLEPEKVTIEPSRTRVVPWRQATRGGNIDDRKLSQITVSLPPKIALLEVKVGPRVATDIEAATREVIRLDEAHGVHLAALSVLLLRAESVASSKIEGLDASIDDLARAMHGYRANASATAMVAASGALRELIESIRPEQSIESRQILDAHRILLSTDPDERGYAGVFRDMQNWIGGSDHSPLGAQYVPPPPELVVDYVEDLLEFTNRTDLNPFVQAAIAHAQFESIHPFTDGNGRIGRALINTVLRRRGITRSVVIPIASALVAHRDAYFLMLQSHRDGDAAPLIRAMARASAIAASESRNSAERLRQFPTAWNSSLGRVRRGSTTSRILERLASEPVFVAEDLGAANEVHMSNVYAAIDRLHQAEIIRPLSTRVRNQIWAASDVVDELEALNLRIAARARKELLEP